MSYYCEVALTLLNEDYESLVKQAESKQEVIDLLKMAHVYRVARYTTLHWGCVKWTDDYVGVRFLKAFIKDDDERIYHFIRIGDDVGDVEESQNYEREGREYLEVTDSAQVSISFTGDSVLNPFWEIVKTF